MTLSRCNRRCILAICCDCDAPSRRLQVECRRLQQLAAQHVTMLWHRQCDSAAADNALTGCPVYLNSLRCSAGSHAATAVLAAKARLPSGVTASAAKGCCPASNRLTTLPLPGSSRTTCLSAPAVYKAPAVCAQATAATPLRGTPPHQAFHVKALRVALYRLCLS